MTKGSFIELVADDGHRFAAWQSTPVGPPRGAVVIAQEIFGVNAHIRAVTDGYAADGYLAIAPALFDRVERNYDTGYSPPEIDAGAAIAHKIDIASALKDVAACMAHVKPAGKVGIIGYCWGGTIAWVAATRLPGLACSVAYYPGGIADFADEQPKCPVMLNFAEKDRKPTAAQARAIAARQPSAIAHFYDAGHGFNCDLRGSFEAASSALARERTLAFLARHLD